MLAGSGPVLICNRRDVPGICRGFPGHLDNLVGGGRHCRSNRRNLNGDAHGQALRLEDRCQSGQGRKNRDVEFRTAVVDEIPGLLHLLSLISDDPLQLSVGSGHVSSPGGLL